MALPTPWPKVDRAVQAIDAVDVFQDQCTTAQILIGIGTDQPVVLHRREWVMDTAAILLLCILVGAVWHLYQVLRLLAWIDRLGRWERSGLRLCDIGPHMANPMEAAREPPGSDPGCRNMQQAEIMKSPQTTPRNRPVEQACLVC